MAEKQNLKLKGVIWKNLMFSFFQNNVVYFVFILIIILFIALLGKTFLNFQNFTNILRHTAIISLMAITMTFTLSAGEFDLSIGSVVGLSACVGAVVLNSYGIILGVIAALAIGFAVGTFNGIMIAYVKVPSFLVTLTSMSIIAALSRWVVALRTIPINNDIFSFIFGAGNIKNIPILFIWTIVFLIVGYYLLNKTQFGKEILATGGNEEVAYLSGINTKIIKVAVMIMASFGAAVAGLIMVGRLSGARYDLGQNVMFNVFAAVVIGGTSLYGGRGNIIGALFGSLIIGTVNNGLLLFGLDVSQQMFFSGAVLLAAITINVRTQLKQT